MGVVREMMVPGIEGDPTGIEEPSEYPAGTAKVYIAGPSEMGDGSTMMSCLSMHTSWWGHSLEYHWHCQLVCSAHIVTPSLQLYEDKSSSYATVITALWAKFASTTITHHTRIYI